MASVHTLNFQKFLKRHEHLFCIQLLRCALVDILTCPISRLGRNSAKKSNVMNPFSLLFPSPLVSPRRKCYSANKIEAKQFSELPEIISFGREILKIFK